MTLERYRLPRPDATAPLVPMDARSIGGGNICFTAEPMTGPLALCPLSVTAAVVHDRDEEPEIEHVDVEAQDGRVLCPEALACYAPAMEEACLQAYMQVRRAPVYR